MNVSLRLIYSIFAGALVCLSLATPGVHAASVADTAGAVRHADQLQAAIDSKAQQITAIFKDIHQHPELGFEEVRTAKIVADELRTLGFSVTTGIGKTGVMAMLKNGEGPTVLYRADMDANAVEETTGLPYASNVKVTRADGKTVPVAHMCGHDAHVSWMLGMAHAMVELKSAWSGTLILVAQPAEELIAGAAAMVEDGLYSKHGMPVPDYMLALHSAPVPLGLIFSVGGVRYAGTDQLDVTFFGQGGHGSMPHLSKDPVVMAASAILQYQSIVSRNIDPQEPAVLTVGAVQAGTDNNVISDKAVLKLNLRWYSETVREQLLAGIERVNRAVAIAQGLPEDKMPVITMKSTGTPLVNDTALAARIASGLAPVFGKEQVIEEAPAAIASEDAHLLLGEHANVPLAYLMLGITSLEAFMAAGGKPPYSNHSGDYIVELDAIPYGSKVAAAAALELLAH